jgi:thymidine kinase
MFAGKTEELVRRIRDAEEQRLSVRVYKPSIDTRYGVNEIVSHSGVRIPATPIPIDPLPEIDSAEVVAFDEVQFFGPTLLPVVERLLHAGNRVIVTGLDLTAAGEPFGIVPTLLALADEVTKLSATCSRCGEPANRSQRLISVEGQVWIGGAEAYEPRCRDCFSP